MAAREIGAADVRAVGMLDDEMRVIGIDPARFDQADHRAKRTNFQLLTYVFDSLVDLGMRPIVGTNFTPTELASGTQTIFTTRGNVTPPKDMARWTDLVTALTRHIVDRYGRDEARGWIFEVWNEPNLSGFWAGTQEQYFDLYRATFRAVREVDSHLRLCGPSTARGAWAEAFLTYCRRHDCVPDVLATHLYANDTLAEPLSPFDNRAHDQSLSGGGEPAFSVSVMHDLRSLLDSLNYKGEVHWNEWGRSWFPHYPPRETVNEAAFIVDTMLDAHHLADRYAYWNLSDVYDQVGYSGAEFCGHYGMLSLNGLRKPNYHAHQLLCRLDGRINRIDLPPSAQLQAWSVVGSGRAVMLSTFRPDDSPASPVRVDLAAAPGFDPSRLRVTRLGAQENNIVAQWRSHGAPDYPSRELLRTLKAANTLSPTADYAVSEGRISFTLERPGVALVEF